MRGSAAKLPGRDRRKDAADPVTRTPEPDQEGHTEQSLSKASHRAIVISPPD